MELGLDEGESYNKISRKNTGKIAQKYRVDFGWPKFVQEFGQKIGKLAPKVGLGPGTSIFLAPQNLQKS